jgi:hypothetical protein
MILCMHTPINPPQAAFAAPGPIRLKPARPSGLRRVVRAFGGLILPAALLIVAIGCFRFLDQKQGSGNVLSEERAIDDAFEGVSLVGSPTLKVTVDENAEPKVVVTTDDNLLLDVITEVRDGVLVVNTEGNLAPTKGIRVEVTVPTLTSATLTGSGDITVDGLKTEAFTAKLTGSGDIQLRGSCETIELDLTGSGDLDAEPLEAQKAKAKVNGSGDIALTARESADLRVNGSGDISVAGKPTTVSRSVNGSGDIRVK